MSDEIGTYSFFPWLRQGIANNIKSADLDPSVKLRAKIQVDLKIAAGGVDGNHTTHTISKDISLYGPGDIVGIDGKAIIKNEPLSWITNFEPNYLPYIDFYDEDLPWRYTPAAADAGLHRLRPWIALAVLTEDEFQDSKNILNKPLPFIAVADPASALPPAEQLWAWAHVHINRDVVGSSDNMIATDTNNALAKFETILKNNPDLAYSRILSPRKLNANTAYHAFLVPVFESGRLAGLGLDPNDVPAAVHASFSAWASYTGKAEPQNLPYYHRWFFRTGSQGDFEYLVRLLKPRPMDSRVGRRDMDVQNPGSNIAGITGEDLGGILKLGGALRIPFDSLGDADKADVIKYDEWATPFPHPFQTDLASFINLADDYSAKAAAAANSDSGLEEAIAGDKDPLITPPLYGRWHAMVQRLLEERDGSAISPDDNWVHELNLDPRWRVPAGFGTSVIQDKQEEYMDAAWEQVGDVLAANRRIRLAQMAREASWSWYHKHILPLQSAKLEKGLLITAPVQKRILAGAVTVYHRVNTSLVPHAVTSAPMRRIAKPRGKLVRALGFENEAPVEKLVTRINDGEVAPAPPKSVPESLPSLQDLARELKPPGVPNWLQHWLTRYSWPRYVPLLLLLIALLIVLLIGASALAIAIGATLAAAGIWLFWLLRRWTRGLDDAASVREDNQTPEAVDDLPNSPDFQVSEPGDGFTPTIGIFDSLEAVNFKAALRLTYEFVQLSGEAAKTPQLEPLNLRLVAAATLAGIDPRLTLPRLVLNQISIPMRIIAELTETFTEAMAYPELDIPMYKPLLDISQELFLPNINFIPQNSISLLETNQKFIESYMLGLNHEFARELLWREYPTDQRGSYFRQFWDVSGYLDKENLDPEDLKEKLRDIPELHLWSRFSKLGDHDHREKDGDNEEEVVLVIRGELLRKYPTAVIYAHRAQWQLKEDGTIDAKKERRLDEGAPIQAKMKTPLYEAKADPDIYFFGFDLTVEEAQGGTGENPGDDPGWFFVIKERPGEPRFGLDIDQSPAINVWNDLAWEDVVPGVTPDDFIDPVAPDIHVIDPSSDPALQEKVDQFNEDKSLVWDSNTNAAVLAYILYQVPVLVAVHAAEMLPKN